MPYEEDANQGKDRPVLILGWDGDELAGVPLSSKDPAHRRDAGTRVPVGTGGWDRERRPSWADADRLLRFAPSEIRREGSSIDRDRFDEVVAHVRRLHGYPAPSFTGSVGPQVRTRSWAPRFELRRSRRPAVPRDLRSGPLVTGDERRVACGRLDVRLEGVRRRPPGSLARAGGAGAVVKSADSFGVGRRPSLLWAMVGACALGAEISVK